MESGAPSGRPIGMQQLLLEFKAERARRQSEADWAVYTVLAFFVFGCLWAMASSWSGHPAWRSLSFVPTTLFAVYASSLVQDVDTSWVQESAHRRFGLLFLIICFTHSVLVGLNHAWGYAHFLGAAWSVIQAVGRYCVVWGTHRPIFRFTSFLTIYCHLQGWAAFSVSLLGMAYTQSEAFVGFWARWGAVVIALFSFIGGLPAAVRAARNGSVKATIETFMYAATISVIVRGTMLWTTHEHLKNWSGSKVPKPHPLGLSVALLTVLCWYWKREQWSQWLKARSAAQRAKGGSSLASLMAPQSPNVLFDQARRKLRRVPWTALNEANLANSEPALNFDLMEPCEIGDIDFFISHCWSDDVSQKVRALEEIGSIFFQKHGRMPYAWLDKLCMDQRNIMLDLRCLPVFEMACNNLLILCGPAYPTRLWCAWELFVFITTAQAQGLDRVQMVTLEDGRTTTPRLSAFELQNAHCSSPEDEQAIRGLLEGYEDRFQGEIQWLGQELEGN